jgi:hypothetical protein
MPTRLLSIAFACLFSMSAQAQLSSDRFSPINYFGRYHGFGYSDGYHACKDGRCSTGFGWQGWSPMSTLSEFPTSPPSNRIVPMRSMGGLPQYSHPTYVEPSFGAAIEVFGQPEVQSQPTPSPMMQIQPSAPSMGLPAWSPSPQRSMESVPASPVPLQPSASDRMMELPAPPKRPESISPAPEVQSRRLPPGSHSLIQQSTFRLR